MEHLWVPGPEQRVLLTPSCRYCRHPHLTDEEARLEVSNVVTVT